MKPLLAFVVFSFLLAACAAPQTPAPADLYAAFGEAQATADAKNREIEYYGIQLTGTAEAPFRNATLTASGMTLQAAFDLSTETAIAKTEAANKTATATYWTLTPTFTPTPNMTQTLGVAEMNAQIQKLSNDMERERLNIERKRISNDFWAVSGPMFIMVILLAIAYAGITYSRTIRRRVIPRDEKGNAPLLLDIVDGDFTDQDANPNYTTRIKGLPAITPMRQESQRRIQAEFLKRLPSSTTPSKTPALPSPQTAPKPAPNPTPEPARRAAPQPQRPLEEENNFWELPQWDRMYEWDGNKGIPYGVNSKTGRLEVWDYTDLSHLAVFGMTGSGKSRGAMRPLIAGALASNQYVILVGKETDYQPFIGQPNAVVIPIYEMTYREEALKYAYALEQCVKEMNRRARHLVEAGASTWQRAGYATTFLFLDEIGNSLRQMPKDVARISYNHTISIVNEGRKVGMNLVFSTQRPKSFSDLTTQCAQAVFRVRNDRESWYALGAPGAEKLKRGYFYSRFTDLSVTGAFQPTDEDLLNYLRSRNIKALEKQNWIDGEVKEETKDEPTPALQDATRSRILELAKQGKTESEIIREVWGITSGGRWYRHREELRSILPATTPAPRTSTSSAPEIQLNS